MINEWLTLYLNNKYSIYNMEIIVNTFTDAINDLLIRPPYVYPYKLRDSKSNLGVELNKDKDTIFIYYICIDERLQGQHMYSDLLRYIANIDYINTIKVIAVINPKMADIMNSFVLKGRKFKVCGSDYIWCRQH